jgi:hypothetical protein
MARGMFQEVECLPNKHEALGSNPSTFNKKQTRFLKYIREGFRQEDFYISIVIVSFFFPPSILQWLPIKST